MSSMFHCWQLLRDQRFRRASCLKLQCTMPSPAPTIVAQPAEGRRIWWGFPQIRVTFLGVPIISTILGFTLGSPYLGKLPGGGFGVEGLVGLGVTFWDDRKKGIPVRTRYYFRCCDATPTQLQGRHLYFSTFGPAKSVCRLLRTHPGPPT